MHKIFFENKCLLSRQDLSGNFVQVNAAGGLVHNHRGEFLLIRRNGLWDLPKGHQEPGEDIAETAVREVVEETGLHRPERGELLCVTDHCYRRDGIWHLKHTWWYNMYSAEEDGLVPQTEEGISQVIWAGKDRLPELLRNTYPSIREVFKKVL